MKPRARSKEDLQAEIEHLNQKIAQLQQTSPNLQALETVPQLVWTTRADGEVNYLNRQWLEYSGQPLEKALGKGWIEVLHHDDQKLALEKWHKALQTEQTFQMVYRLRRTDGNFRWFLSRAWPIRNSQNQIQQWFGISTDIDEQKRAEQGLQLLVETSNVLAATLDYKMALPELCYLLVSDLASWCVIDLTLLDEQDKMQYPGAAHADPAKQEILEELVRQYWSDFSAYETVIGHALQTGQADFFSSYPLDKLTEKINDSHLLQLIVELDIKSFMVAPLIARERTLGFLSLVRTDPNQPYKQADLTLVQELAHRIALVIDNARLYQQAQRAIHLRDEFLSVAAHELRTPITSLKGYSQMIMYQMASPAGPNPQRLNRSLEAINRQSDRLAQLVTQLLEVSRLETGRMHLNIELTDLNRLVEGVVSSVQLHLIGQIKINFETAEQLTAQVDPLRLEQVILNLLNNAINSTPANGTVTIELSSIEAGQTVQITVTDQGNGILPEQQAHLFERFYQGQSQTNNMGLGLGLYLSRQIVELHGGQIEAQSPSEGGSRFVVKLPKEPVGD